MNYLRGASAFAVAFAMLSISVHAQEAAAPTATAEPAAAVEAAAAPIVAIATLAPALSLPAATQIILTPDAEANSKKLRVGNTVAMHTLFDVTRNGAVVIPKGARAMGTVTWRTGKGAFGKSAKMEITFRELTLPNGDKVALTGMHRQEGEGNTGAAVGAAIAVGVFGAFVTGKSAIIPVGQQLTALTSEPLAYSIAADAAATTPAAPAAPTAEAAPAAPAEPVAATTPTGG